MRVRNRYYALVLLAGFFAPSGRVEGQGAGPSDAPQLHHVGLNSVDPERAIQWYLKLWPAATKTTVAGQPGVQADMLLLFTKVATPPRGAWKPELHRSEAPSAFWHIGALTNTTNIADRLKGIGVATLTLFTSATDKQGVWRSGLAPYAGNQTAAQIATVAAAPPRDGGFSYVLAPDGVLFELNGTPDTKDSFTHLHFYREQPLCTANWYVEHLGMELPPVREGNGPETPHKAWDPCAVPIAEPSWPSLEPVGTIRGPAGTVRFANGMMSAYPRQCVNRRCGTDQPLVPTHGQPLDHLAFTVKDFEGTLARLKREGVKIVQEPYKFGSGRAFMIEDPDGLSIEIVELRGN